MSETQLYVNGKIFTSNEECPFADAMVVSDGEISWIGNESKMANVEAERIDLKGEECFPD